MIIRIDVFRIIEMDFPVKAGLIPGGQGKKHYIVEVTVK